MKNLTTKTLLSVYEQMLLIRRFEENIEVGRYYHFAHNMHLYARDLNKNNPESLKLTPHEKLLMSKQKEYH